MRWYSAVHQEEPYTERNVFVFMFVLARRPEALRLDACEMLWGKAVSPGGEAIGSGGDVHWLYHP
jgi:hypothetical protein